MNDHVFRYTDAFQEITGLSYSQVHVALNNELRRNELTVDPLDWGKGLIVLLQNNNTNLMGFLVAAFINFELESETLALLSDVDIFGTGDCNLCGGRNEHDETLIVGKDSLHVRVKCNNCYATDQVWIEKDQSYYE